MAFTCESEEMMLIAPMSCSISSAAIVSALIRDSANATSSFRFLKKKFHHSLFKKQLIFKYFLKGNYYRLSKDICEKKLKVKYIFKHFQ